MLSDDNQSVVFLSCIVDYQPDLLLRNGVAGYDVAAYEAECPVDGDIAVDEVLDGTEVGNDDGWTACGNEHLVTIGLRLCQSKDGGWWDFVGLETDQRAVYIEKKCISWCSHIIKVGLGE